MPTDYTLVLTSPRIVVLEEEIGPLKERIDELERVVVDTYSYLRRHDEGAAIVRLQTAGVPLP